ncbi:ubiquitin carboxyl-terminal hydrolase [Sorochytrium milnesiophthora]
MADDWCLIESDPAVFTELIQTFGAQGLQVEEVWDLETGLHNLQPVYGVVFLFKWEKSHQQEAGDSAMQDARLQSQTADHVFFAKQVITNACATQAILSVLLNIDWESARRSGSEMQLGEELSNFRSFTSDFDPEFKGLAITNSDTIRRVHNSFARMDSFIMEREDDSGKGEDAFHFIAYVPVGGVVYELDGLKSGPVAVGPIANDGSTTDDAAWLNTLIPAIQARIARYMSSEIRFNLMAVIKDRALVARQELTAIESQMAAAQSALQQIQSDAAKKDELAAHIAQLTMRRDECLEHIQIEEDKTKRYKRDNARRRHNFIPLVFELLKRMAGTSEWDGVVAKAEDSAKKRAERKAQ